VLSEPIKISSAVLEAALGKYREIETRNGFDPVDAARGSRRLAHELEILLRVGDGLVANSETVLAALDDQ